ncbi:hypothetical protein [Mesorhizobium sp. B2-4-11]|uniref:hypothetical protein n=1 Tax=Mesorhizobium sp. B2-4-11 TaxID=2589938 RepID=UPI00112E565D|nr:hypothetical protein [Mesorhizobium sp. B2-4-11]TPL06690.1 hypothetical protein FJ944_22955 [Mesorhizobium sp. B2-4-11]
MANPINLPAVEWTECSFDPMRPRATDRMEGRRTEGQSVGTPWWTANYKPGWLEPANIGLLDAFMMQAGDDGETFLGYDVFRPRPILMDTGAPLSGTKAGGGAFNGTATLNSITNSRTVVIGGLPAGFQFSPGDYIEFRMTALMRSLHRIMAPATANGSGIVTLSIKYGLDTQNFTTSSVVNFEKASCVMQIDPGSYSGTKSWESRSPSFSATEVFIYEP